MGLLDSLGRALLGPRVIVRRCDVTVAGAAEDVVRVLIEELVALSPTEIRRATTDHYFEGVITKDRLPEFCEVLQTALGAPVKPFGARPAFDDELQARVDSHGGIEKDQCLHLRAYEGDGGVAFGALWPWSDGKSITLKVGSYD